MRFIIALAVVVVVVVGVATAAYSVAVRGERAVQPLVFNHRVHIEDADLECIDCHTNAHTAVRAGLPGKTICLDCHDIDDEENTHPEKDKMFVFEDRDDDIPWVRVAVTPPDVFFSHRRHVAAAGLDCAECHPDQTTLTEPPPTVKLVMTMTECIACHEQNNTTADCLACHR